MTKMVRVENADTAGCEVVVEVWDKGWPEGAPDVLVATHRLPLPTSMTSGVFITNTRYLVVKEAVKDALDRG